MPVTLIKLHTKIDTVKNMLIFLMMILIGGQGFSQAGFSNSAQSTFKDFGNYSMHSLANGYNLNAFNSSENTKGRRYFFDEWVKGSIVSAAGKEINGDEYFFNFDKVNNNILVTKDKKEVIEVNKESIKEIHFTEKGIEYNFEKAEKISSYRFVEVLVKNDKLSLYKTINTKLVKANYTTNGLTESGNPYDEYVDEPSYILSYKGEFRPVILKFRSIKSNLKEESKKVNDFYADHLNDEVDEDYLKGLVIYINN
jgi:hypothetical protein